MNDPYLDPLSLDTSPRAFRQQDLAGGLQPGDVVEVPLLLSGWQASALEREAHHRGLTAGEMLRRLLGDFLSRPGCVAPRCPAKAS